MLLFFFLFFSSPYIACSYVATLACSYVAIVCSYVASLACSYATLACSYESKCIAHCTLLFLICMCVSSPTGCPSGHLVLVCPMVSTEVLLQTKSPLGDSKSSKEVR